MTIDVPLLVTGLTVNNHDDAGLLLDVVPDVALTRTGPITTMTLFVEAGDVVKETLTKVRDIKQKLPHINFRAVHQDLVTSEDIAWRVNKDHKTIKSWTQDHSFPPAHNYILSHSIALWEWAPVMAWISEKHNIEPVFEETLPTPTQTAAINNALAAPNHPGPQPRHTPDSPDEPTHVEYRTNITVDQPLTQDLLNECEQALQQACTASPTEIHQYFFRTTHPTTIQWGLKYTATGTDIETTAETLTKTVLHKLQTLGYKPRQGTTSYSTN